jgi:NADH:ubiquinone oxidoreductase subunit 5 (subunit L)/multisubunit Na+/H+ antiporter MnhA subunit
MRWRKFVGLPNSEAHAGFFSLSHMGYMLVVWASQSMGQSAPRPAVSSTDQSRPMKRPAFLAAGAFLHAVHQEQRSHFATDHFRSRRRGEALLLALTLSIAVLGLADCRRLRFMSKWQIFAAGFETHNRRSICWCLSPR